MNDSTKHLRIRQKAQHAQKMGLEKTDGDGRENSPRQSYSPFICVCAAGQSAANHDDACASIRVNARFD